jgi:nitronate monooxygenase
MPFQTRVTEVLGIEHPILLAPMDLVSTGRLASAVSQSGGLGLIGGGYGSGEWLEQEFGAAGNSRVGCGFITWSLAKGPELLDLALSHRPAAVMLSFGDPSPFAARIRDAGAKLICQVQSLKQAQEAASAGADVLVAQGTEAGGHGASRATMTLVPEVADAFPAIPVVASGGIADGRGFAAAMVLGAEGVLMGTRFYASQEAQAHPAAKRRIVDAGGDDTVRSSVFDITRKNVWPDPFTGRVLRNAHAERWLGREKELMEHAEEEARLYAEARERGDFDKAAVIAGEAVGLIHDVPPAAEIVDRVIRDAEAILSRRGWAARPAVSQGLSQS